MSNEAEGTTPPAGNSPVKAKGPVEFFSTYPAKVATSTSQVTLPKAIKKLVEEGDEGNLMLLPNNDHPYWYLYTRKQFSQMLKDTRTDPKYKENNIGEDLADEMAEAVVPVDYDTQGRFVLSKEFVKKLGGEKNDVIFTGGINHLKLWTQADYDAFQEQKAAAKQSEEYKKARMAAMKR